jgi:hypothetical protein
VAPLLKITFVEAEFSEILELLNYEAELWKAAP